MDNTDAHGQSRLRTSPATDGVNARVGEYILGAGNSDFTVSFWFNYTDAGNRSMVFDLTSTGSRTNQFRRNSANNFGWHSVASLSLGSISQAGGFHHMVLTQITGNVHMYIDNSHVASNSTSVPAFDDLAFKCNVSNTAAASGSFDEITVWNDGMTHTEYLELHNNGEWFNPNYHSKKANLLTWHTMGDGQGDHVQGTGNGEAMIKDLAGTNEPLNLFIINKGGLIGAFAACFIYLTSNRDAQSSCS